MGFVAVPAEAVGGGMASDVSLNRASCWGKIVGSNHISLNLRSICGIFPPHLLSNRRLMTVVDIYCTYLPHNYQLLNQIWYLATVFDLEEGNQLLYPSSPVGDSGLFSMFVDDTKIDGIVDSDEDYLRLQKDLDRSHSVLTGQVGSEELALVPRPLHDHKVIRGIS
eukprot:g45449.t1